MDSRLYDWSETDKEKQMRLRIASTVKRFLEYNHITLKEAAQKLSITPQALSNQLSGRKIGENVARNWAEVFGFNPLFLLVGEGHLLRDGEGPWDDIREEDIVPREKRKRVVYQREIDNNLEASYVYLLPTEARGGTLADFSSTVKKFDCERVLSPIRGADYAMTVTGDSMAPEYESGCQVIIKRIDEEQFVEWGKTYVLDTCNGAVIKKVYPTDDRGVVECRSVNPAYPPFKIQTENIRGWYRVLLAMSLK